MDIKKKFNSQLKNLENYLALVEVNASSYQKSTLGVLKLLVTEQKTPGVYVTLNKPFDIMQRLLQQNKIDENLIIFIDGITKVSENTKVKNCLFVGSPEKLSDISVAMDQAIKALPTKEKFVFFDSINTLQIFNKAGTVVRFVYFLASKIREWKVKGIILLIKKSPDDNLATELMQFCDAKIDFGGA
ncbi:hypothetical protein HYX01_04045 [Candidatus Woesearchaeota archaeon]|nr:hypothetical protein [Candidatus Woesearchaeota archaeon]